MQAPTPPIPPPDDGWHQWLKLIIPGAFVAIVVLLWGLIRPGITKLIYYFLGHDDGREVFARRVRDSLETKDGQRWFEKYAEETMMDLHSDVATTKSAATSLQRDFKKFETTLEAHSVQLADIKTNAAMVPELKSGLERAAEVGEKLESTLSSLQRTVDKMEAREEERRRQDDLNHPKRRRDD